MTQNPKLWQSNDNVLRKEEVVLVGLTNKSCTLILADVWSY